MTGGRLYWANRWAANRPWTRLKPTRPGFGLEVGAAIDRSRYTGVVGWFLASLYRVHRHLPFFVMPLVSPSVYASRLSSLFSFFVNIGTYSTIKESDLLRRVRRYNDPAVVIYYFCARRIGKKKIKKNAVFCRPEEVGPEKVHLVKSHLRDAGLENLGKLDDFSKHVSLQSAALGRRRKKCIIIKDRDRF